MTEIQLNLVVIRSNNIERSAAFYKLLGITFIKHQHGTGLEHFTSELGTIAFEIYPLTPETVPTTATRLGFQVASVDAAIQEFEKQGASIISHPRNSPWGRRAVVADPDGHRVELTEAK